MSSAKRTSFFPVGTRSIGLINDLGFDFISDLGRNLTRIPWDIREASYLFQWLSVAIQRFNTTAFRGTFVMPDREDT